LQHEKAREAAAHGTDRHRAGDRAAAERLYRDALRLDPQQPDALHGLGVLAIGGPSNAQAIGLIGRALALRPGIALYSLNLGLALLAQGHVEEARASLHVAVLQDPADPRAHAALATVLDRLGRRAESTDSARQAPGEPGMQVLLGRHAIETARWTDAVAALSLAVRHAPSDAGAWHALGVAYAALGQADAAERCVRQVASLRPDDPAALANLAARLFETNRFDEALALLRRAVSLGPPTAETLSNLGLVLMALGDLADAEAALSEAARLAPSQDGILVNHGTALLELGRRPQALCRFEAVETRSPGSLDAARARFDRATLLLAAGDFHAGWPAFEARRLLTAARPSNLPDWDGTRPAKDAAVLIEAEQGLGDIIHFLRYVAPAMRRARIVLALPQPLVRLARQSLPGCTVVALGTLPDGCVARADLLSLPLLLGLVRPVWTGPYLAAPTGQGAGIGLCWAGSPGYRFDRRRSLPLSRLAPLGASRARFVSLQHGAAADEPAPAGLDLLRPEPPADLADTAALIAGLDLVISVDTAIAHLAGALGRPVWLLNRFGGDWRWQDGNRAADGSSLWYPSLRPFQQPTAHDAWDATIAAVANRLQQRETL
jgi:Flp pilus assembly protein TadD